MNMSINLLAVLVSLAMMLTGATGEQPGDVSASVMTLRNVTLSVDGESVTLEPELRLGVQTDGSRALFDLSLLSGGKAYFPVQLAADDEALTVLFDNAGQAIRIPESALSMPMTLTGGAQNMEAFAAMSDYFNAEIALIKALNDPESMAATNEAIAQAVAGVIDRGEGLPGTMVVGDAMCDATVYSYHLGNAEICAIYEAACSASAPLNDFYRAMLGLYSNMGMGQFDSLQDMLDATGLEISVDVTDTEAVDGGGVRSEAELNFAVKGEALPMGMAIGAIAEGERREVNLTVSGGDDNVSVLGLANIVSEGMDSEMSLNMSVAPNADGGTVNLNMTADSEMGEDGSRSNNVEYTLTAAQVTMAVEGHAVISADGTGTASVAMSAVAQGHTVSFSYDMVQEKAPFEDRTAAANAIVLDNLQNGQPPEGFQGAMMQIASSLMQDAQALSTEDSVVAFGQLFQKLSTSAPLDVRNIDVEAPEAEPVEGDDGVLSFELPEITYIPEGYTLNNQSVDTEYDYVSIDYVDDDYHMIFISASPIYRLYEAGTTISYTMGEDGTLVPVDGGIVTVDREDDGSMTTATWDREDSVWTISCYGGDLSVEEIGRIINGMK